MFDQGTLPKLSDFIIKDVEDFEQSFTSISSESESIINEDFNPPKKKLAINLSKDITDYNNQKQVTSSQRSIHKIIIAYQDCGELKKKIIKEVQQIKLKSLKKHNKIEFSLIPMEEEAPKKRMIPIKEEVPKKRRPKITKAKFKGSHKNLPKILGSGIISFSIKHSNSELIEQFIEKRSRFLDEIFVDEAKNTFFSVKDFIKWIKTEDLKKKFVNLKTFRDIWGFKLLECDSKGFKHLFYCCILKRISKYYMKNEFFRFVFKKVRTGSIQTQNAICYLDKIPLFLKGLKIPENLRNIKEMTVF